LALPLCGLPRKLESIVESPERLFHGEDGASIGGAPSLNRVELDGSLGLLRAEDSGMDTVFHVVHLYLAVVVDAIRYFLDAIRDEPVAVDLLQLPDFIRVVDLVDLVQLPYLLEDVVLDGSEYLFCLGICGQEWADGDCGRERWETGGRLR